MHLKHFSYRGPFAINDHKLNLLQDKHPNLYYLNIRWNVLETLLILIEARHWRSSSLPRAIMSSTPCLRELNLHTMSPQCHPSLLVRVTTAGLYHTSLQFVGCTQIPASHWKDPV